MRIRSTDQGLIVARSETDWVSLERALAAEAGDAPEELRRAARSMLSLLALDPGPLQLAADAIGRADPPATGADPEAAGLPFPMRSMRAFSVWESHMTGSARTITKRFMPAPLAKAAAAFERISGRDFPAFKPKQRFYEEPAFYMGNHTALLADGEPLRWPSHTEYLDFELELACVLARPVPADSGPDEAEEAIGGWFVLNDWSARDVQADDYRHNVFGPVVKSKTFANSIGSDVVTPDQIGRWDRMAGRVLVDDEVWCEGTTEGPLHSIGEMIAYAARGEALGPGDVISTGTMPGCCGLELDRWIRPGQTVRLEIDGIGSLSTPIVGASGA